MTGCGGEGRRQASDPRTLTATIGYPEPHTIFAPGRGGGGPAFSSSKILERLARFESDRSFSPVLATSWKIAPDHKSIAIDLRSGVKWHDGKDFTADDVKFSIEKYWKPFDPNSILDFLVGVQIENPRRVVVRFSEPVPQFSVEMMLAAQASYILPRHIYDGTDILVNAANNAPVGTGPWQFGKWVRGSYAEFEKNPSYWQAGQPKLDKLIIRWWREPASRAAAFETGELDVGVSNPVPLSDLKRLQADPRFTVQFEDEGTPVSLYYNVKRPILSDRRVRQALLHAVDRDFIARTIYHGYAKPGISPILTSNPAFFTADVPKYDYDPAKAARLLDAAGYPVKADGKRFHVDLVASGWSEENGKVGAYLRQVLQDLKIDTNLRVPDRPNSLKALYTDYDFDIAYSQGGGTANDPVPELAQLYSSAGIRKGLIFRNASRYATPEMDALVRRITLEVDPAKRRGLVQQFARLALTDVPLFPIVEWPTHIIRQKSVQTTSKAFNWAIDSWGDVTKIR